MQAARALALAWALAPGLAGMPAFAQGAGPACGSTTTGGDFRRIDCTIAAAATPQRWRLTLRFGGGHDDTSARIERVQLDGQDLACAEGSKLRLFGEDGEVSLWCRIAIPAGGEAGHRLWLETLWSHAQWLDFALAGDSD